MSARLAFCPRLAFDKLDLLGADGGMELVIPAWLVDRPDVLAALSALHAAGGTEALKRVPDWHDVIVDISTGAISVEGQGE